MCFADILAILFPQENACHLCQRWAHEGILCALCLRDLTFSRLAPAQQALNGYRGFKCVLACWAHAKTARRLVHQLKYHTDPLAAGVLGKGMADVLISHKRTLAARPILIPVPLHPARERKRGYNQAALLADAIAASTGLDVEKDVLYRVKATQSMVTLTPDERLKTMRDAFAVTHGERIKGRHVLLVDDVFTTGATTTACALPLMANGAKSVSVITACRA